MCLETVDWREKEEVERRRTGSLAVTMSLMTLSRKTRRNLGNLQLKPVCSRSLWLMMWRRRLWGHVLLLSVYILYIRIQSHAHTYYLYFIHKHVINCRGIKLFDDKEPKIWQSCEGPHENIKQLYIKYVWRLLSPFWKIGSMILQRCLKKNVLKYIFRLFTCH